MKFALWVYHLATSTLVVMAIPLLGLYALLAPKHRSGIRQRLGCYPPQPMKTARSCRIWIHAASVGEVRVAEAVIGSLRQMLPHADVVLSTITSQGHRYAKSNLDTGIRCIYAPIDWRPSVRKAFATLQPDILACLETEIWPNLLTTARQMGVKTALLNGRISNRSIKRYLHIRPFMRSILQQVAVFSMIRDIDAKRICKIGASAERVVVNGNAKYDLLLSQTANANKAKIASRYDIKMDQPVFVAGSTRRQEDEYVLEAFRQIRSTFPDALLIIAPRHVVKSRHIESIARDKGFDCQMRTDLGRPGKKRTAPVVILDTIGELQATYSIASVVFCGGSLVPLGGQNVLEAAVWRKPVLYGPSMEDFQDARELLEKTGGGILVADQNALVDAVRELLSDPEKAKVIGERARRALLFSQDAAHRHAAVIVDLLKKS